MTCPQSGSKSLGKITDITNKGYLWAFVLTQANLLLSTITTKVYRRMKRMSWEKAIMWNIAIYLAFTLVFIGLIIKLRLAITFQTL